MLTLKKQNICSNLLRGSGLVQRSPQNQVCSENNCLTFYLQTLPLHFSFRRQKRLEIFKISLLHSHCLPTSPPHCVNHSPDWQVHLINSSPFSHAKVFKGLFCTFKFSFPTFLLHTIITHFVWMKGKLGIKILSVGISGSDQSFAIL